VVEVGADLDFAFDGDGDGFFAINDQDQLVNADFLTALPGELFTQKASK
jgi:phosphomannomutase